MASGWRFWNNSAGVILFPSIGRDVNTGIHHCYRNRMLSDSPAIGPGTSGRNSTFRGILMKTGGDRDDACSGTVFIGHRVKRIA
jgi:hypothetical protein